MSKVQIPKDKILVGIRREDKSYWERRVVLIPEHAKEIMNKEPSIQFVVQPSDRRIFSDNEYFQAGCIIEEDLSICSVILGVKEIPPKKLMPHKTYMFFSHTIKAQQENMPTLDHMLKHKIRMLDYEKIIDEKGARQVAFGRFAGIAGAIDYLAGFGQFLLQKGYSTPFLRVSPSYKYIDLKQAYSHIRQVGQQLIEKGIPQDLQPLVFAITGKGRCSLGAMEVIENLPIKLVKPEELKALCEDKTNPNHNNTVYVCYIESQHMVANKAGKPFDKSEYYRSPQNFKPIFSETYLPYITSIFHNMYWDQRFPRLISTEELRTLWKKGQKKLIGIGDVTCDFEGSIEFLRKFTTPDEPFWVYNPVDENVIDGIKHQENGDYILYQSLDFLPCELALDASTHFSSILKQWIPNIAKSNIDDPYEKQTLLPNIKRSMITLDGKLTPDFEYITKLRLDKEQSRQNGQKSDQKHKIQAYMKIQLYGNLFGSKNINAILDICENHGINFTIHQLIPGLKEDDHSNLEILMGTSKLLELEKAINQIQEICNQHEIRLIDASLDEQDKPFISKARL